MIGYVARFRDLGLQDVTRVGGKNASLGEMIRSLGVNDAAFWIHGGFRPGS
jgi:phosphoenolpyruvate synthase/pyruvate phosphate dikinase